MLSEDHVHRAFALPDFDGRAAQRALEPTDRGVAPPGSKDADVRPAAALCYVFRRDAALWLPLEVRQQHLSAHAGQVALPGGRPELGEALEEAAWREAQEEIGLARSPQAATVGRLHPVYIPITHTRLDVFVALGPDPGEFVPAWEEVAAIPLVPLDGLVEEAALTTRTLELRGVARPIPHLEFGGVAIWGATAMALSELATRLRAVS